MLPTSQRRLLFLDSRGVKKKWYICNFQCHGLTLKSPTEEGDGRAAEDDLYPPISPPSSPHCVYKLRLAAPACASAFVVTGDG
ncbi:hypothetical protein FKM82_024905 [Ascaphus truei]